MHIVVLGAGGQLASDLINVLDGEELTLCLHTDLDIADAVSVRLRLDELKPDVVLNAAAYNLVDRAETDPAQAFLVNSIGPMNVARACALVGAVLVHFSTDYVFGHEIQHPRPWKEEDLPGPQSVYAMSKLAGEHAVRSYCPGHFILRTCGLYGSKGSRGKGGNFVETMLKLAAANKPVRVVNDQTCTPSYTRDVANATAKLVQTKAYGMYHVTNAGNCTWFEFAREVFRQSALEVDCRPISSDEFGAAALRPSFSVLDNQKLAQAGVAPCPPWTDALSRYLDERRAR